MDASTARFVTALLASIRRSATVDALERVKRLVHVQTSTTPSTRSCAVLRGLLLRQTDECAILPLASARCSVEWWCRADAHED